MYILNGEVYENNDKTVSPTSQAFMFGYGLFETSKVLNGKILFLDEHIKRLEEGCKTIGLSLNTEKNKIVDEAYRLLELKGVKDGVLKILYAKDNNENYLLLTTRENSYSEEHYSNGFKLMFSELKRNQNSILTYVKSNNYMENILAKEIATDNGFDEVIFLNTDGFISEGAVSNIFWIKDNAVYTPSVECGLLQGIVREKILVSLNRLGLKTNIGKFTKSDLIDADEVFITNSIMDIMPVSKIEDISFNLEKNIITRDILDEYNDLIGEEYER